MVFPALDLHNCFILVWIRKPVDLWGRAGGWRGGCMVNMEESLWNVRRSARSSALCDSSRQTPDYSYNLRLWPYSLLLITPMHDGSALQTLNQNIDVCGPCGSDYAEQIPTAVFLSRRNEMKSICVSRKTLAPILYSVCVCSLLISI